MAYDLLQYEGNFAHLQLEKAFLLFISVEIIKQQQVYVEQAHGPAYQLQAGTSTLPRIWPGSNPGPQGLSNIYQAPSPLYQSGLGQKVGRCLCYSCSFTSVLTQPPTLSVLGFLPHIPLPHPWHTCFALRSQLATSLEVLVSVLGLYIFYRLNTSTPTQGRVANSFPHVAGIKPGTPGVSTYTKR